MAQKDVKDDMKPWIHVRKAIQGVKSDENQPNLTAGLGGQQDLLRNNPRRGRLRSWRTGPWPNAILRGIRWSSSCRRFGPTIPKISPRLTSNGIPSTAQISP